MRRPVALALIAVVAVSWGCGGGSSSSLKSGPAPVSTTGGGWKAYAPAGGGYDVQIQTGWITVDAASLAHSTALKAVLAANPGLASSAAAFEALARRPGVLVAVDRTTGGRSTLERTGFAPNIVVRSVQGSGGASDAMLLRAALSQGMTTARALPAAVGSPAVAHITIAGVPGGSVTYRFHEQTSAGMQVVSETDYVAVKDDVAYTIFCSTVADDVDRLRPICGHVVGSFAITR